MNFNGKDQILSATRQEKNYKEIKISPTSAFFSLLSARRHWNNLESSEYERMRSKNSMSAKLFFSHIKAMKKYFQIEGSENIFLYSKKTYSKSTLLVITQCESKEKHRSESKGLS